MKKLISFLALITIFIVNVLGQSPQAFKYQAVARDNSGNILANHTVSFRISILKGSSSGTAVYVETQNSISTNQFGLVNLQIGLGTPILGTFSNINWGNDKYYVKIEMDPNGGTIYTNMGTSQLLSVPYALYSENTGGDNIWVKDSNKVYMSDTTGIVGIGTKTPISKLYVYGSECLSGNGLVQFTQNGATNNPTLVVKQIGTGGNNGDYQGLVVDVDGIANGYAFGVNNSGTPRFVIQNNGYVGVGTTNPSKPFHVNGESIFLQNMSFGTPGIGGYGNRGSITYNSNAFIISSHAPYNLTLNSGTGNVGIGTTNPQYTLSVNGTIQAKEIIVNTGWSDFVFDKDYDLMSLKELEQYINKNGHLPDVPTAKEVEEYGVKLGDANAKLLQKIEELTIYVIDLNKMVEELKKENELLKKQFPKNK